MTFRAWWERWIWPPRADVRTDQLAASVERAVTHALEARDRDIAWLQTRNAELTQQLIDAHQLAQNAKPLHNPQQPTVEVITLPDEVVRAIANKAGHRWERTELGRDLAAFATSAIASHTTTEEIVRQIEDGEKGWS